MSSNAALPPVFPKLHGQSLLPPHPHLLLAGTARQIADWAVQSVDNRSELYETLLRGNEGLVEIAEKVTRLTLTEVKALYATKGDLLYKLTRIIETEAGPQIEPETLTVCNEPELALLNYWIYCELFHHDVDYMYRQQSIPQGTEPLKSAIRGRWFAYCMPDRNNKSRPDADEIEEYHVLDQVQMWRSNSISERDLRLANFWTTGEITPDDPEWRDQSTSNLSLTSDQGMFMTVAANLGRDSLEILLPGGMRRLKTRLENLKRLIKLVDINSIYDWHLGFDDWDVDFDYDDTVWCEGFHKDILRAMGWW